MPSQHVETLETIHALKRTLRREKEAATDQPISSATNRGNKLKKGASYVHAGALPYPHGSDGYKQQIEHAGYTRYVLEKNPRRYNEYGDELEDSESDPEADADAEDENPYSNVHLQELLRPLTHPAELATHPTLSIPFLDSALSDMVQTTEEKLRQERASLWRAKHLHRQLLGDESWMPSDAVETNDDWDLFQPRPFATEQHRKKRKRDEDLAPASNGDIVKEHRELINGTEVNGNDAGRDNVTLIQKSGASNGPEAAHAKVDSRGEKKASIADDADMQDAELAVNGIHDENKAQNETSQPGASTEGPNGLTSQAPGDGGTTTAAHEPTTTGSSPRSTPPPSRRITRALAAETSPPSQSSTPQPPSPTISTISSSLLTPDPLFLLPPSTHRPFHNLALPKDERDETRRLLTMYIQKQEETIRSTENVLGKLIKALRMRDQVFEWSKAEGHVGEWSDGEDWIDAEHWGEKEENLKKGKDEDDAGAAGTGGPGDEDGGHGVGIQGAGGKKKRRRRAAGGDRE